MKIYRISIFFNMETGKYGFANGQLLRLEYTAILYSTTSGDEQQYTINDQVFKDLPALQVKTGDYVKLTLQNNDSVDNPIHIHGHFALVIKRNGEPVMGTIMKDTVLV